ncbi:unnamed protein product [Ilex paraguariensis]|uniref:Ribosomal protein L34Ae n=1 Tax=Ilex paraguariensis TaxID=185542 RepID=A0ABC8QUC8_9AQUA
MDTQKFFMLKSYFNFMDISFLREFADTKMFRFCNSVWDMFCTFMLNLFGLIVKYISRFQANGEAQKNDSSFSFIPSDEDDQVVSKKAEESETVAFGGKENFKFSFGFPLEKIKDSNKSSGQTESSGFIESKYQSISNKNVTGFMEEPETHRFTVQEFFLGSNESLSSIVSPDKDTQELNLGKKTQNFHDWSIDSSSCNEQFDDTKVSISEIEVVDHGKAEDFAQSLCSEEVLEELGEVTMAEHGLAKAKEREGSEDNFSDEQDFSYEVELRPEIKLLPSDSNTVADVLSDWFVINTHKVDLVNNNGLVCGSETDTPMPIDRREGMFTEKIAGLEEIGEEENSFSHDETAFRREKHDVYVDDYIELEPHFNSTKLGEASLSLKHLGKVEKGHELLECMDMKGREQMDSLQKSEEHALLKKSWDWDSDDEDEPDILLEHRELVEQMKMEMKNSRAKGLPTILEESETAKMVEDLKPLKIDDKFEYKDRMEEIQKFYKSYAEKMRKLDILNYQTMHAISFLHLKDPIKLTLVQQSPVLAIKSLHWPNVWPCKPQRIYADPTLKSINELHRDLEMVYVGQACLSWEILHWQYGKAKNLLNYDSEGHHSYNQVADEFQQFQVLVQRFMEDESFQGPRVQIYVKNRSILRSFLQVPIIKDDCSKEKKGKRDEEENAISIAMLVNIIEETMRIFWDFFHADKDEPNVILKGPQGTLVDLQDPTDAELLMDARTILHEKEKRLKEILRSGNCIVKKFQKHQGGRLGDARFISQVELRLISRVLSLSRLTRDQLVWCQKKLDNINFVNRKIHVEPLFLLFPC